RRDRLLQHLGQFDGVARPLALSAERAETLPWNEPRGMLDMPRLHVLDHLPHVGGGVSGHRWPPSVACMHPDNANGHTTQIVASTNQPVASHTDRDQR